MASQAQPKDESQNIANIIIPIRGLHTSGVYASYLDPKRHAYFAAQIGLRDVPWFNRRVGPAS